MVANCGFAGALEDLKCEIQGHGNYPRTYDINRSIELSRSVVLMDLRKEDVLGAEFIVLAGIFAACVERVRGLWPVRVV